ncbi:fumarylacetoacetase [Xylaria sp. FL1042]|nr:fumarylacetoacetase [Xylaria sp. FL1042]
MADGEHFSIANIPYGIASDESHSKSVATRFRDNVFFLNDLNLDYNPGMLKAISQPTLNSLAARTKPELLSLRANLQQFLSDNDNVAKYGKHIDAVKLYLPVDIRGFTDYSCSKQHGENSSIALFGKSVVPETFPYFPMGYSGRPSSIVVSGTDIRRPCGMYKVGDRIEYGVCKQLDYELEMACIIGKPSELGEHVPVKNADEHIFGLVLLNDWTARDIQKLEMMPLGPMNSKSFGTSISPWVVTLEALSQFEAQPPHRDVPVTAYLEDKKERPHYNITLEASIMSKGSTTKICTSNISWMYWTFRDLVAQQTVNGCNVITGDVLGTGTVSGKGDHEHGCLLEMTQGGKVEFTLSDGQKRTYLQDGDTLRMTGYAGPGVGFGECTGLIIPARPIHLLL